MTHVWAGAWFLLPKGSALKARLQESASLLHTIRLLPCCLAAYYLGNMLTQVIAIDYGSRERLKEILDGMLGEENFKLVQVVNRCPFWPFCPFFLSPNKHRVLTLRIAHLESMANQTSEAINDCMIPPLRFFVWGNVPWFWLSCNHKEEIDEIRINMRIHYLPTSWSQRPKLRINSLIVASSGITYRLINGLRDVSTSDGHLHYEEIGLVFCTYMTSK